MPLLFPYGMGFDVSGEVVEIGKDVHKFKAGDAVFARPNQDDAGAIADFARVKESDGLAGGSTGPDMTDKVDRDGAKRLVDLAAKSGVSRFVMLSTVGAENPNPESKLAHYLQAKHDADEHLKAFGLSYAIVRPVPNGRARFA